MKKILKPVILTSVLMAALIGGAVFFMSGRGSVSSELADRIRNDQSDQADSNVFRYDLNMSAVELKNSGPDKNILNFDTDHVYSVANSNQARERLDRLIKRLNTTFENPVIAADPFGTMPGSVYFYFTTSYQGMVRYTVTVEDNEAPDFVRYIANGKEGNVTDVHEFCVTGLVPGQTNYILLEMLDSKGNTRETTAFKYDVPKTEMPLKLSYEKGRSEELCEGGLFALFPQGDPNIYLYDNSGMLRRTIRTEGGHGSRLYQYGDSLIYQIGEAKVARVSGLGRVTGVGEVKGYGSIRDFSYDGYDNIYALVTKKGRDYLVSVSLKDNKTRQVYAFPKGIRMESVTSAEGGRLYASAVSPAGLVRLDALTGARTEVSLILGNKKAWKKTPLKKKVKQDDTVAQWDLKGAKLNLDVSGSDGNKDYINTYLYDKKKGTGLKFVVMAKEKKAEIIHQYPVGEKGNCLFDSYGNHYIMGNCGAGIFSEYDEMGKVTREFTYGKPLDGMTKLSLYGINYYSGE